MVLDLRELADDFLGELSAEVLPTDTVIASSTFGGSSGLPSYFSTTRYLPLVLANDTLKVYEVVYVVGHAAGANTVTVQRGKEGTTPLDWHVGDAIRVAPTKRDIGSPMVFTGAGDVPADLAVGARHALSNEKFVRERTAEQGSLPSLRSSVFDLIADIGSLTDISPTSGLVPRLKAFPIGPLVTHAGGYVDVYWRGTGPTGLTYAWNALTEGPDLRAVSAAFLVGHLVGSDPSWKGHSCLNQLYGIQAQGASFQLFTPSGAALSSKQIRGAVVLIGV